MRRSIKRLVSHLTSSKATNGSKNVPWMERIRTPSYQKWFIGILTTVLLALLVSPAVRLPIREYNTGDIASKEIKSSQDLLVEDEKLTQEMRVEAERSVLSIYDYDPAVLTDAEKRVRSVFESLSRSFRKPERGAADLTSPRKREFERALRISLTPKEWQILQRERFTPSLGEAVLKAIGPMMNKGIAIDKDLLDPESYKGVQIRNIQTRDERKDFPPFSFLDFKEAKSKLSGQADFFPRALSKDAVPVILKISEQLVRPNLTFNRGETEDRKNSARERVTPVYFQLKRGEMILRPGERVRDEHVVKLNALRKAQESMHLASLFAGLLILAFLVLVSLHEFSTKNIRKFVLSQKDLIFFSTMLIGTIALLKLSQMISDALGGELFSIPSSSYSYLFPIAASAMLVRIVINSEVAIVFSLLTCYFSAIVMSNQLSFFIFALVGSLAGAHKVARCEQRNILLKAGLWVGGANLLMILSSYLLSGSFKVVIVSDMVMGFLAGPLASILVLGIAPIIESLFGYTTDIKLLELASMENPILKDLVVQAPGTYHHSIIVGSLAEAAAKSIAANPLLSRVSAYYHDIGKLKKPLYFIENSGGMENKHDHLVPTMSGLILASHVKDGLEIAREHRLGQRIAHIIQQHHGTSLISYFYQKAKEKENAEMDFHEEMDFRYPGPKPQTKEAGIVMLADSVEAASRSLSEPTPSRIKSLVQRIMNSIFLDGQLEDCELTLKDLQKIEESFNRILTAIFHQRIDYPSTDLPKKRPDEDQDSKSTKTYPFGLRRNKKGGPKDIDRVGTS